MLTCTTRELGDIYGCSVQYIGELVKSGQLPKPIKANCHDVLKACRAIVEILKGECMQGDSDLKAEQLRLTKARARKAELEVLETSKILIPVAEVSKEIFESNRIVRDAFLNVIPRTAAILAAQSDVHKVREIMEKEFRQVLEHLSNIYSKEAK